MQRGSSTSSDPANTTNAGRAELLDAWWTPRRGSGGAVGGVAVSFVSSLFLRSHVVTVRTKSYRIGAAQIGPQYSIRP